MVKLKLKRMTNLKIEANKEIEMTTPCICGNSTGIILGTIQLEEQNEFGDDYYEIGAECSWCEKVHTFEALVV